MPAVCGRSTALTAPGGQRPGLMVVEDEAVQSNTTCGKLEDGGGFYHNLYGMRQRSALTVQSKGESLLSPFLMAIQSSHGCQLQIC
eukprot:1143908-Pelagomonas_calceolata.AAC.8